MSKKLPKPEAIILDIEGTVTDRGFFKNTLLPFIKNNLNRFLDDSYGKSETIEVIQQLRQKQKVKKYPQMPTIVAGNKAQVVKSLNDCILWLMKKQREESEVKQIELLVWLWGYEKGLFKYRIFDDVSIALHQWKVKYGIKLYVYSSAMICGQKLVFVNTNHGNIHCLIDQYFDSSIGSKRDPQSYRAIAQSIKIQKNKILLIDDSVKEAKAAIDAGLNVVLIKRPGNKLITTEPNIPIISSFTEILFN